MEDFALLCFAWLFLDQSSRLFFGFHAMGRQKTKHRAIYESGVALAKQHEYAKAAIELQNSLKLQNDKLEAWRALAEIDEATRNWDSLIRSLQSIVEPCSK